MAYNQGLGVATVQVFEQSPHGSLLLSRPRIGRLSADVQPTLVAYAYRVGVVVQAVGADHPFRTTWLYLSVTTDNVVVADAEFPVVIPAVPRVNLSGRGCLVGPDCTAVNHDQCNGSHRLIINSESLTTLHEKRAADRRQDRYRNLDKLVQCLFLHHFHNCSL